MIGADGNPVASLSKDVIRDGLWSARAERGTCRNGILQVQTLHWKGKGACIHETSMDSPHPLRWPPQCSDLILNLGPQSLGRRILRDQCRASRLKVHLVIWYNFASVEELVPDQENKEERDGEVIGDESLRARSVWGLSLLRWDY